MPARHLPYGWVDDVLSVKGPTKLVDYVKESYDVDAKQYDMTSTSQKTMETLMLLNNMPDGNATIVIGMPIRKLQFAYDLYRYPLDKTETLNFIMRTTFVLIITIAIITLCSAT